MTTPTKKYIFKKFVKPTKRTPRNSLIHYADNDTVHGMYATYCNDCLGLGYMRKTWTKDWNSVTCARCLKHKPTIPSDKEAEAQQADEKKGTL